jgi:hypothetical protein
MVRRRKREVTGWEAGESPRKRQAPTEKTYRLDVSAPGNGRVGKATIVALDEENVVCHTDRANLMDAAERRRVVRRMAKALQVKDAEGLQADLDRVWHDALNGQRRRCEQAAAGSTEAPPEGGTAPVPPETYPQHQTVGACYVVEGGRICHRRRGPGDSEWLEPLCNFEATITKEVSQDDGSGEVRHIFTVKGVLDDGTQLPEVEVPAAQFSSMDWVVRMWGVRAVVNAGMGTKDHLRAAIQILSGWVPRQGVFGHTGWRQLDKQWVYLHAGGPIGPVAFSPFSESAHGGDATNTDGIDTYSSTGPIGPIGPEENIDRPLEKKSHTHFPAGRTGTCVAATGADG